MAKKKNSKKDPYQNHYLMQEGKEISRMIRAHNKEAARVAKMTVSERKEYDEEWVRKIPVKFVKTRKRGIYSMHLKKPTEPICSDPKAFRTASETMLQYHRNRMRARKKK